MKIFEAVFFYSLLFIILFLLIFKITHNDIRNLAEDGFYYCEESKVWVKNIPCKEHNKSIFEIDKNLEKDNEDIDDGGPAK